MEYFKSEADRIIFCLLELDGETRQKKLNITKFLFFQKEAATIWRDNLIKVIDPTFCDHPKASCALEELNSIYYQMTYHHNEK